jgi:hypothetical protein
MSVDLAIKKWKDTEVGYPPTWPYWKSPAVFVDNDGDRGEPMTDTTVSPPFVYYNQERVDEIYRPTLRESTFISIEPTKGLEDNRLFAAIENLGDLPADGVTIKFSYAPWGVIGGVDPQLYFKSIATVSSVSFGAHARREVEVPWDLSNLSENNGGLWPASIEFFQHFCVQVSIDYSGDIDTGNNWTQHNYGYVVSRSPFAPFPVMVTNSENKPKRYELVAENIPQNWKIRFRGLDQQGQGNFSGLFTLEPGEGKVLTFTIMKEENDQQNRDKEIRDTIYITLRSEGKPIGGISFDAIQFPKETSGPQERHIPRFVLPYSPPVSLWRQ